MVEFKKVRKPTPRCGKTDNCTCSFNCAAFGMTSQGEVIKPASTHEQQYRYYMVVDNMTPTAVTSLLKLNPKWGAKFGRAIKAEIEAGQWAGFTHE